MGLIIFWPRARGAEALWRFVPATSLWVYEHPDLGQLWQEKISAHRLRPVVEALQGFALEENGQAFWIKWQGEALQGFVSGLPVKFELARSGAGPHGGGLLCATDD